jgi:hypothetical protein
MKEYYFQACLCVMECDALLIYYGIPGFIVALTISGILIRYTKRGAYINPAKVGTQAIFGNMPPLQAVILLGKSYIYFYFYISNLLAIELAAAWSAFQVGTLFWRLKLNTLRENLYLTSVACYGAAKVHTHTYAFFE